jgi:hypothetical protein
MTSTSNGDHSHASITVIVTAAARTVPLADGISEADCERERGDTNEQSHPRQRTGTGRCFLPGPSAIDGNNNSEQGSKKRTCAWKIPPKLGVCKNRIVTDVTFVCATAGYEDAWSLFLLPSREATAAAVGSPSPTPPFFRRGGLRRTSRSCAASPSWPPLSFPYRRAQFA